jgi:glutathione S-transferase
MERILYQFPISHYCEKVRWALDYKGLPYTAKNLLPGLHLRKTKKMAPKSYVPILLDGKVQIQNSRVILDYLDETYPERPLTPTDDKQRQMTEHWETFCDVEIGPHVRRYCYHVLLDYPKIVIPFFTKDGPWWGPLFFKVSFKKLVPVMRKVMNINEQSARESQAKVQTAIDILYKAYNENDYLVGNTFTRADLCAAAMLAPLFMPDGYGLDFPKDLPPRLKGFVASNKHKMKRLEQLYLFHR